MNTYNHFLRTYQNQYIGRKALVFTSGPSILDYRKLDDEDSFIKVGIKQVIQLRDDFNFYFFYDKNERSKEYEDLIPTIKGVKFCISTINGKQYPTMYTPKEVEKLKAIPLAGSHGGYHLNLHNDFRLGYNWSTLHISLIFLIYSGIRDIYLVGCDCSSKVSFSNAKIRPYNIDNYQLIWNEFLSYFRRYNIILRVINPVNFMGDEVIYQWPKQH